MAIERENKPVEEKNGMKVTDNMDGEKKANEKLDMQTADLSDKMNTKQINDYIKAYQSGSPVKDLIPPGLTKSELIQLEKLAEKRS
jgi:hypothetical protein